MLVAGMWLPQPPTAGMRRFELTMRLAQHVDVTYVGGLFRDGDMSQIHELQAAGVEVRPILWDDLALSQPSNASLWSSRLRTARLAFGTTKYGQIYWQDKAMPCGPEMLRALVTSGRFDVIHVEACLVHWLRGVPVGVPLAVDYSDIIASFLRKEAHLQGSIHRKALGLLGSFKAVRYERSAARRADICTVTSAVDAAELRVLAGPVPICEVPNGVDTRFFCPSGGPTANHMTLLFTGAMGYGPNADAAVYFVRSILPLIRRVYPQVRLQIVGNAPAAEVQALAAEPGVEVTGWVPDVRPYFEQASVVVVPLRLGSGTRLKILQALAMQKAVVSTTLGAEGLTLDPSHIARADSPREFAGAVLELLADIPKRDQLGVAGRRYVMDHYDWEISAAKLRSLLTALAEHASLPAC